MGKVNDWRPIESKPPFTACEERGVYTDTNGNGLFFFKATHWRPLEGPDLDALALEGADLASKAMADYATAPYARRKAQVQLAIRSVLEKALK